MIIGALTDVWVEDEEVMKVFVEVTGIDVWADVVIDTLSGDVINDVASDIGVEVLLGVNANVLVAAMTAL